MVAPGEREMLVMFAGGHLSCRLANHARSSAWVVCIDDGTEEPAMTEKPQESMFRDDLLDLWYKDAILYELDVETFADSNGDGIGDFPGLTRRLDYLSALGVTCLWLNPFFPSPNRDDGYDIADFYSIDPRLGSLGDFVEFMHLARERGIRVLADLVVNHTSDQHPWFQAARKDPHSPYRDYYLWSKEEPQDRFQGVIFPGRQKEVWTYDDVAGAWYFHRFFSFQPDLNIANSKVREEIRKIMGFWIQLGVSGFRVDAAPFLIEQPDVDRELRELREFLSWRCGDAILLAEANVPLDRILFYFGDGTKMHMLFNFLANQYLFAALATADAGPLREVYSQFPPLPPTAQWANFLRNHDECDLGRLPDDLRQQVYDRLGRDERAQIFDRGLRRRVAPMFENDQRRIRLANSLMFSLPGTPVLRYGDDIGMGDDLDLEGRSSVRTPMQWSNRKSAGFSSAEENALVRPVIGQGEYGYQHVNVEDQRRKTDSQLHWMQELVRVRKECPEIGRGQFSLLETADRSVLVHRFDWSRQTVIIAHNLADRPAQFQVALSSGDWLIDLFGGERFQELPADKPHDLEPYGFRWLRLRGAGMELH
jgi:maltose alpha-D-glucosyltransferase/alpha-amylase